MTQRFILALGFCSALLLASAAQAQTIATPLLTKDIPEFAGKEVVVSTVEFPAGVASAPHRHDAHTFVYVLEGTVVMQVGGGPMLTLSAGQTFYESPADVHATSKNASQTAKAKILVFMLKDKGKPGSRPAQ